MSSLIVADCKLCSASGWEPVPGSDRRVRRCKCSRLVKFRAAVPPRYWPARITDFPKSADDEVQRLLSAPENGLLVTGPVGTGKTHLAAAIVWLAVNADMDVLFRAASDFFAELRNSFQTNEKSEQDIMQEYCRPSLLILDDLGSGSCSDHERRSTLELLDNRLNYLRPMVITTNLTIEQFAERFDERIASRLSSFRKITLTGRDHRRHR